MSCPLDREELLRTGKLHLLRRIGRQQGTTSRPETHSQHEKV